MVEFFASSITIERSTVALLKAVNTIIELLRKSAHIEQQMQHKGPMWVRSAQARQFYNSRLAVQAAIWFANKVLYKVDCWLLQGGQEIANSSMDQQQEKKERGDEKAREERRQEKR